MLLLGGLKKLLHEDGLTIKGAQKTLRENGVAHVADLSPPLDDLTTAVIEGTNENQDEVEEGKITSIDPMEVTAAIEDESPDDAPVEMQPEDIAKPAEVLKPEPDQEHDDVADAEPLEDQSAQIVGSESPTHASDTEDEPIDATQTDAVDAEPELDLAASSVEDGLESETIPEHDDEQTPMPSFRARPRAAAKQPPVVETTTAPSETDTVQESATKLPSENKVPVESPADDIEEPAEEIATATLKPRVIDLAPIPAASQISVDPAALTVLTRMKQITPEHAREIKPLVARLTRLRASMANPRKEYRKD